MTTSLAAPPSGTFPARHPSRWTLDRTPPAPYAVPRLDPAQQAVVALRGGPLLVLAGPGTGKTTTLVEAVAARVARGVRPEAVLVLTFSRKAADELRERVSRRLLADGRAAAGAPAAWTFHAWCLALLREHLPAGLPGPRLLSGPERLVRVRELVQGLQAGEGRTRWPASVVPALGTRGFARELADLLDRVRERGLEPADLAAVAAQAGREDWAAAAAFYAEYVDVLGLQGELDYGELVRQALRLLEDDPDVLEGVRRRYSAVFVDEYQDTDPAQERMLALLAGGGRDLVVVGDPDQAVYGFRGAEVDCLLGFPDRFPQADGRPAPTIALGVSRRAGATLLEVSRTIATRLPAPGLPVADLRAHRRLRPARREPAEPSGPSGPSAQPAPAPAQVRLFATAADEAAGIADLLRREHLEQGRPWTSMAVLVRSGRRSVPLLRRALGAAGVPVAVAADEVPVARDPAVVPLLTALRVADELRAAAAAGGDPAEPDPPGLDPTTAHDLLLSGLARATPSGLRRLGRALRAVERAAGSAEEGPVLIRPSAVLVREALLQPGRLVLLEEADSSSAEPLRRLHRLLTAARDVLLAGGGADEALWSLWDGSGLARRLAQVSATGGRAGRAADRDLDAVVGVFEEVGRLVERVPRSGVPVLLDMLESQEIPSADRVEGRLAAAGAVRLLTAHRSKGLEWDLVVVAGVQDGVWPDLRRRGSLLAADRIGPDGERPAASASTLLVDERRLFYVALTRARERVVVTAVASADEDGDRPSRFLAETGLPVPDVPERPVAVLSAPAVAGRLRQALLQPGTPDADRAAAASGLARLAPHLPAADPERWWGVLPWSPGARPVRPPDVPVELSGSAVSGYETCPLQQFLRREARAAEPSTAAQGFGLVIHALARLVADGALEPDIDLLMARLDDVWEGLGFEAAWHAAAERRRAHEALSLFLHWHADNPREVVAAEQAFEVLWRGADPDGGEVAATLRGSMDRVERDGEGRLHVVDLKTGRQKPSKAQVVQHPQLGVYQVALRERGEPLGGAELVQLYPDRKKASVQAQPALDPGDPWADAMLGRVAGGLLAERFPARPNEHCDRCVFRASCPAQDAGGQVVR